MIHLLVSSVLRCARLVLSFGALAGLVSPAFGQGSDRKADGESRDGSAALLFQRDREAMHPGRPLTLVGIEQGGNDFRARSPALAKCDRTVTRVATEESRRRLLSMYEQGTRFHEPPASFYRPIPGPASRADAAPREDESATLAAGDLMPACLALALFAPLGVWIRRRFALPAPPPPKKRVPRRA